MKRGFGRKGLADYNFCMLTKPTTLAVLAVLAGCATQEPTPPEKIGVYESVTGAPQVATIIKRLWVETWPTAFVFPTYGTAEEAAADLRERASSLGGNGVINFGCYKMRGDQADSPLACNGTVVRFK